LSSLFVACAPSFRVLFTRIWFLFARSSRKRCLPGTVLPMGGTDTHWPISSSLPAMSAAKSVDCDRSWHNASFCLSLRDDWRYMAGDLSCARLRSSRVTKSRVTKSRVVRRKVDRFCVALPRNFPLSRHIARFHSGALRFRSCRMESRIAPSSSRHNLRECAGGGITWGCGML
jgi:hypothetical protein